MQTQQQIIHYLVITLCMTCKLTEGQCRNPNTALRGFFHPDNQIYEENASVNYKCDPGLKTLTGGWWSTITCREREWSHTPQCIDKTDCITPEVLHAQIKPRYVKTSYKNGDTVHFDCDKGYEPNAGNSATCLNGDWTPLPICEPGDKNACPAPPKKHNAVVLGQDYQPSFDEGTVLEYKCRESHEMNGATQSTCEKGGWTETGSCELKADRPAPTKRPSATGDLGYSDRGTGTTNPGSRGVGGQNCPDPPLITNGDVISQVNKAATYQCANFYKLVGSKTITCSRDGEWQTPPTCEANFCKVMGKVSYLMELNTAKYINEGASEYFQCDGRWYRYSAIGTCNNGNIHFRGCGQYDWAIPSVQ
ncbi:complement factor H-related protein 1-like isoform X1 [Alosa sapidissima]|uniref:complement factor H-related protein 1-like isoform X1 n=1 Tax=Alosa sapidissima TaxID=34773 RepID=UPI001C09B063|nr:complement factor H-related protein 1-like isoform X1 [Alosa sapidissima]